jgi:CRISPR-associated protein Csb2
LALEWLEGLPPPLIAAPRANRAQRVDLFVPNNDADAVEDPRDVSGIRTKKVVHPFLSEEAVPFVYAWPLPIETSLANVVVSAAENLYQFGRGVDMAWAVGDVIDDASVERLLAEHRGIVYRPEPGARGAGLACPMPGSLASLRQRYGATRLRPDSVGRSAVLFVNAPKACFQNVVYACARHRVVYELRDPHEDVRTAPWQARRAGRLVCAVRDSAAGRLRGGLPSSEDATIERTLIGRKADGNDASSPENRVRIVPLPSVGVEHADGAIRRILVEVPSSAVLRAVDIEWALSGLEVVGPDAAARSILTRAEGDEMLRHYERPSRRWRSVTAVVLPQAAARRRIQPSNRHHEGAKTAGERMAEEERAVAAVRVALRHAGIRANMLLARVQREPFDGRGARAEAFAPDTRFAKERLWHVDLELDRLVTGPLVIGDGRFLGLGVMAPLEDSSSELSATSSKKLHDKRPIVAPRSNLSGVFALGLRPIEAGSQVDPISIARALRRAVMARAQDELGAFPLDLFFSGHTNGAKAGVAGHLAFQWDASRRRLLVIAPHWLDRREPMREELRSIDVLDQALGKLTELRAGSAGRFAVELHTVSREDPLLCSARAWVSATPYVVTRHKKRSSAREALVEDAFVECRRRLLPLPRVTVLGAYGVPARGLEGKLRLEFQAAVTGPIVLGRTRLLGGGLFAPALDGPESEADVKAC